MMKNRLKQKSEAVATFHFRGKSSVLSFWSLGVFPFILPRFCQFCYSVVPPSFKPCSSLPPPVSPVPVLYYRSLSPSPSLSFCLSHFRLQTMLSIFPSFCAFVCLLIPPFLFLQPKSSMFKYKIKKKCF